jgi:hypothetical protein
MPLTPTPETRMRARLLRPGLVLAAVSTCVLAVGASAAPTGPVLIEDVAGDANLLNSQFISDPTGNRGIATPGSQPGLDIVKVELKNTFAAGKDGQSASAGCTGFTMSMTLSGPPADGSSFQMSATTKRNSRFFIIEHNSATNETSIHYGGSVGQGLSYGGESVNKTLPLKAANIDGNTITWTITKRDIRKVKEQPGSVVKLDEAVTLLEDTDIGSNYPVFDRAPAAGKTFTICK